MVPKFFRWIHCGTSSNRPTGRRVNCKAAWRFQHSLKKDMLRRSNEAAGGNRGVEPRGDDHDEIANEARGLLPLLIEAW
jgi:hypothetical protein